MQILQILKNPEKCANSRYQKRRYSRERAFQSLATLESVPRALSSRGPASTRSRCRRGRRRRRATSLANFARLVLGCIDVSDSESRRIFQLFHQSTRPAFFCTVLKSKFKVFRDFDEISAKFCKILENFAEMLDLERCKRMQIL